MTRSKHKPLPAPGAATPTTERRCVVAYDVIRNPTKQSSGDPAFMLRTAEGWPVGLFWSEQYAMQFAAVLNQSIGRATRSSHPIGEPEPGEVDPDEPTPLADPEPDTGDPVATARGT